MKKLLVLVLVVGCGGCKSKQSYREAYQIICDSPNHVTEKDPAKAAIATVDYIKAHVTNEQARADIDAPIPASSEENRQRMIEHLHAAKLDEKNCALLQPAN